jgi:hypothetical protein
MINNTFWVVYGLHFLKYIPYEVKSTSHTIIILPLHCTTKKGDYTFCVIYLLCTYIIYFFSLHQLIWQIEDVRYNDLRWPETHIAVTEIHIFNLDADYYPMSHQNQCRACCTASLSCKKRDEQYKNINIFLGSFLNPIQSYILAL